jgi:hypothetical protein
MHDSLVVRVLQSFTDRWNDRQRLLRRKPSGRQRLPHVHAVYVFHQQVKKSARLPKIMDRNDVRMAQRRECLRFPREPCRKS